jgi:hypothetical protein
MTNPNLTIRVTNLHYYHVDMFYMIIDMQLQELIGRIMKITIELLMCMSCLDQNKFFFLHLTLTSCLNLLNFIFRILANLSFIF